MALSTLRKAPLAVALLLSCAPAHAGWFGDDSKPAATAKDTAKSTSKDVTKEQDKAVAPGVTLEDSIRQAQMLRLAGQYPEAIKHLSQLMMVASDDPRIIGEYGKTLAAMGRASDAVSFLTHAQEMQPADWTIASALGVAYDQVGDQANAKLAYEHALKIKPEEPSVLNNYALSRMLAKDPEAASKLAARAERAGGNSDAKIARNIDMIRSLAPEPVVAAAPAPQAPTPVAQAPLSPAPSVASNAAPHAQTPVVHNETPVSHTPSVASAPQDKSSAVAVAKPVAVQSQALPQDKNSTVAIAKPVAVQSQALPPASAAVENRVVMQKVPVDPLAGPVPATHAPRPLQSPVAAAVPAPVKTADALKPAAPVNAAAPVTAPVKAAEVAKPVYSSTPVKTAETKPASAVKSIETKPEIVKTAEAAKPVALSTPVKAADAKPAEVSKPVSAAAAPVKPVTSASTAAPVKAAESTKPGTLSTPVKAADAKPGSTVTAAVKPTPSASVNTAVPVKAADAGKPVLKPAASVTLQMAASPASESGKPATAPKVLPAAPVKAADTKSAKPKDAIPGLRMSANAY